MSCLLGSATELQFSPDYLLDFTFHFWLRCLYVFEDKCLISPRLTWNFESSCLSLLNAEVTDVGHRQD